MSEKEQFKKKFLKNNSIVEFQVETILADCSKRKYERIIAKDRNFILMDCPPKGENIEMFIVMSKFLQKHGFSAPQIYDYDAKNGLLLLEDLGKNKFTNLFPDKENPDFEKEAYLKATELLLDLHNISITEIELPHYDDRLLMKEVLLMIEHYIPVLRGEKIAQKAVEEFKEIWTHLFHYTRLIPEVIVLRDYHADNLIWLSARNELQKVGLLDFQDAVIGSRAYDLVCLLEDARRDVPKDVVEQCINHYVENSKIDITRKEFLAAYAILGAQKNCKIAGIFARKAAEGNAAYLKFIPRVIEHIKNDLQNPLLFPLKKWLAEHLPENFSLNSYDKVKVRF